jgi:hypothetical protein
VAVEFCSSTSQSAGRHVFHTHSPCDMLLPAHGVTHIIIQLTAPHMLLAYVLTYVLTHMLSLVPTAPTCTFQVTICSFTSHYANT